jgi:hypothetical protein
MTAILNMLVGSGGGLTTVLNTTLTIGTATAGAGLNLRGFTSTAVGGGYSPSVFGSLASATVSGGRTCTICYDDRDVPGSLYSANLSISGFGSDPGQSYLYDVTANSITKTGSTASGYFYTAGTASWSWDDTVVGVLFGFNTSGTTPLVIRV